MFKRRQYNEGSGFQMTTAGGVYIPSVEDIGSAVGSGISAILGNPAVLAGQQGIATNINKPPAKEAPAQLPDYQVAAPRAVDRMSAGTTGAMALQRMSSGVGAHPGGAGRGKGAGGSLGQEARQAMKRKRLSKRIANRKAKGKDQIQLSSDAPKIRDDYDYAEGGRVGYAVGGGVISKLASKILRQYEKGGRSFSKAETKARNEINKELRDISAKKDLDPNKVDSIYRIKNRLEYIDDELGGVGDDIALRESREIQDLILEREDLLFELEEIVEGPMSEWTATSRAAFTDPSWRMEVGQPLGQRYTTPNFDEIDPADTAISEFQRKTRKPKAFGGLMSAVRRAIKVGKPVELRKIKQKASAEASKLEMKLAKIEEEVGIDSWIRRQTGDMSEEYPNIDFSDANLTDEDVISMLTPAKAREFKKLTKQMEQAWDGYDQIETRLRELGEDPWYPSSSYMAPLGAKTRTFSYDSDLYPTGSQKLKKAREKTRKNFIERNPFDRRGYQEGGDIDEQMADMMEGPTHTMPDGTVHPGATHEEYEQMLAEGQAEDMAQEGMVPDEQMEEDFVDYVVESTLEPEDTMYLEEALAADPRLSEIFDQVIETASEFSGSGPVEGPGSEVSDSIPARLSDGEFVITAKATEEIGPDNLQGMMEQAEMDADVRRAEAEGGYIDDDEDMAMIDPMQRTVNATEREMRKLQLAANPRTQYRTVYG